MKKPAFYSFRQRLNAGFLAVSLIPLLLCACLMLQIFRSRMVSSAELTAQQQLSSALHILDTLQETFQSTADALAQDTLIPQVLFAEDADGEQVYDRLYSITEPLRSFARFDLYDISGNWRYSPQAAPEERKLATNWGILHAAAQAVDNTLIYLSPEDPISTDSALLTAAVVLTDPYGAPVGYLVISMTDSQLRTFFSGTAGQSELLLLDNLWRPIFCTQSSYAQDLSQALRTQLLSGKALEGLSPECRYTVAQHPGTGLYLVLQQPQAVTRETLNLLYTVGIVCALACVIVSVLLGIQLSRQMFRPIDALHRGIRHLEKNDLNFQIAIPGDHADELTELAENFNHMVGTLRRNQQQLLENQQALNEAQIRMLQAQLNPHFLCNTLDTMKWISKINQVPQVAEMSTNLADILRFSISPAEFVPLRKELEILERYLDIQRIRLSDSFTYTSKVPEEIKSCLVPKMLLQPLAENAVLHGLSGVERGELLVTAEITENLLRIRVCDNGHGLPEDLLGPYRPPEKPTGHLGLLNVDTILRKHYGESFGLWLENRPDSPGACIVARLPVEREDSVC